MAVLAFAAGLSALPATAAAEGAESNLKVSGFLSIVGGKITSASMPGDYSGPTTIDGNDCPCYTADWGNAGVYRERFSLAPESRAGIQLKYTFNQQFNAVAQVVTRGSDPTPNVQWAYASYAPSKSLEIQVGRKRIPLYYYSDFQDIGVAYPWLAAPPELYGWEATNYNGVSMRYTRAVGEGNLSLGLFAGKETVKDALYQRLYYDGKTKVVWSNLVGGDAELTRGPMTLRAIYMQTDVRSTNPGIGLDDSAALTAYGLAANFDFENWFVLSEVTRLQRDFAIDYRVSAPAFTLGAGYRFGSWTPFLNFARYKEISSDHSIYMPQSYDRASLTLRYDIDSRSAVKGQLDRHKDVSHNFGGNVTMVRLSYDRLF
ncbi:porin [Massilia glaciei]|uniref:Porin n=1 Tax=Massilia glaciei TaxID=1524097 RepID=A0A2U2HLW5_9BURK|nr:porin [Massilia glaciei]PWF48426.1 hypothetical protein C7C56_011950 [Massilia glaciei]